MIPSYDSPLPAVGYNTAVKQTIFAVEDDTDISRLVRHHLEAAGYGVRTFSATAGVITEAEKQLPALFLLDIMVPGGDGLELVPAYPPDIFAGHDSGHLSHRQDQRVRPRDRPGVGRGRLHSQAFSPRELVARVRAVLRRFERPLAPAIVKAGDIEIDSGGMTLMVRGQLTQTTATEFRLLEYLARHPGRVFTRDQVLDAVWRDTHYVTPRSVDVYVRRIREKIEENPDEPRYLKTVRGAGYRFEIPKA